MKSKSDYNELRLHANEIIRQLYEAGELKQLEILKLYTDLSVEALKKKT